MGIYIYIRKPESHLTLCQKPYMASLPNMHSGLCQRHMYICIYLVYIYVYLVVYIHIILVSIGWIVKSYFNDIHTTHLNIQIGEIVGNTLAYDTHMCLYTALGL
jgi:hypothetical protein